MRTRTPRRARRGISLLEVMIALTILGTALIGMAEYGRRFARTNAGAMTTNTALDLATERLERVKAERNYVSMDTLATTESLNLLGITYTRITQITQVVTSQVDYKIVTVTVTRPTMPRPIKKTSSVARF
jgi:prepilin-type N-terminal cleavage/methylation domain-containing protein